MIHPHQIVIDTSSLPSAVQSVIATIDAAIGTWALGEFEKRVVIDLNAVAPAVPLATKRDGLQRLVELYRMYRWDVDYDLSQTNLIIRTLVFKLPR